MVSLTVDDHEAVTRLMQKMLTDIDPQGTHLAATSAEEALEILGLGTIQVLFLDIEMGRPFETETFHAFIDQLEEKLTHKIKLFYWCDTQSGDYLENRKGWVRKRREMIYNSHGLYMNSTPQGFSLWEYTP